MVEIISKRDGPRREDVEARRHIRDNWGTIEKLADQLSNGGYAARRDRRTQPQTPDLPDGPTFHSLGSGSTSAAPRLYVRISPNNRVVVMDLESGKQVHFLGEIRRRNRADRFCLASAENGFRHPLDDALQHRLTDLDGQTIDASFDEDAFAGAISDRLGLS